MSPNKILTWFRLESVVNIILTISVLLGLSQKPSNINSSKMNLGPRILQCMNIAFFVVCLINGPCTFYINEPIYYPKVFENLAMLATNTSLSYGIFYFYLQPTVIMDIFTTMFDTDNFGTPRNSQKTERRLKSLMLTLFILLNIEWLFYISYGAWFNGDFIVFISKYGKDETGKIITVDSYLQNNVVKYVYTMWVYFTIWYDVNFTVVLIMLPCIYVLRTMDEVDELIECIRHLNTVKETNAVRHVRYCIRYFIFITGKVKYVNNLLKYMFIGFSYMPIWNIALLGCASLKTKLMIVVVLHCGLWLAGIFTYCFCAQILLDKFYSVNDAIYGINWYEQHLKLSRRDLLMFMLATKLPITFYCQGLSRPSLVRFKEIVTAAYGYTVSFYKYR